MAIQKIKIKDFSVLENVEIDFCEGINIFIGENGTGKTHILKFLYAFSETEQGFDKYKDTYVINKLFLIELMKCFQTDTEYSFDFEVNFTADDLNYSYGGFVIHENELFLKNENNMKNPIQSVFIPAKDMVTHSKGLIAMSKLYSKNMPFDKTLMDIIEKASRWPLDELTQMTQSILPKLEKAMGGIIVQRDDEFFKVKPNGEKIQFSFEAEGIKKIGLVWQLLSNGSINKDTILFWDEPEANINPILVPLIVDTLLELSRHGVQIFIATHDYVFAKYFEINRKTSDSILFHSLYKSTPEATGVQCESNGNFRDLRENAINDALDILMDAVIDRNVGD